MPGRARPAPRPRRRGAAEARHLCRHPLLGRRCCGCSTRLCRLADRAAAGAGGARDRGRGRISSISRSTSLFVLGFGWGVAGVAAATLLAEGGKTARAARRSPRASRRRARRWRLAGRRETWSAAALGALFRLNRDLFLRTLLLTGAILLLTRARRHAGAAGARRQRHPLPVVHPLGADPRRLRERRAGAVRRGGRRRATAPASTRWSGRCCSGAWPAAR